MPITITDRARVRAISGHNLMRLAGLLLFALASVGHAFAQSSPFQIGSRSSSMTELERIFGEMPRSASARQLIFEGAIDPAEYRVGPGDRFRIYYWQPAYNEYPATINAEGDLVIPLVGSVHVADMTLSEAREAIDRSVAKAFRSGQLTVSLEEPRKFRVHVTGQVNTPGTYVVPATARVSDAIVIAEGLKQRLVYERGDTTRAIVASRRRIELRDGDGNEIGRADMRLFLQSGLLEANPYLSDGMTIHVPHPALTNQRIGVSGAVYADGLFEYVQGDRLLDALLLAGGLTTLADSSSLLRVSSDGTARQALDLTEPNLDELLKMELSPGDRIYVAGYPDTSGVGSVSLKGQIAHPGGYPIISGVTTLSEVLEQAGGLLPSAAANSARLIRSSEDRTTGERHRVAAANRQGRSDPMFPADPGLAAEFARWDYGTVVLDLSGNGPQTPDKVVLHDGDILDVPAIPLGVRVLGFVNNGGEVPWIEGGRMRDYLLLAGGINAGGWRNRAVVIKARNGSQVRYSHDLPIDPGDVIFVPTKPETTNWERFKDVVTVAAQLATLGLVIINVSK